MIYVISVFMENPMPFDFNVCVLSGNLATHPETFFSKGEKRTEICKFAIAINHYKGKGQEKETSFVDCVCFDWTAKDAAKLQKGHPICVQGSLKQDKWQDKKTGENRSKIVLICDVVKGTVRIPKDDKPAESGPTDERGEPSSDEEVPF
jgi:single stranded DNA-binding protein